jgi:hypothetical protein
MDYSVCRMDLFENSLSPEVCEDIIKRYTADDRKYDGDVMLGDGTIEVDYSLKKCTELYLSKHAEWKDIDELLFQQIGSKIRVLREKYPGLKACSKVLDEGYRIKHYKNDGTEFFDWHIDANGRSMSQRYYVFMWYLNTVEEGGETEFRIADENGNNILVKPIQGRMVTFPPFWTHEHRAKPPISEDKYVIVAWVTF